MFRHIHINLLTVPIELKTQRDKTQEVGTTFTSAYNIYKHIFG